MTLSSFTLNIFTAIATILAGYIVAARPNAKVSERFLKSSMALGAGFLIAVVFFELLPVALERTQNPDQVFMNVFLGTSLVFIFDRWVAPHLTFWDDSHDHEDDGCAHHHEYTHDHGHNHPFITGPKPQHAHAACGHAILGHGAACSAVGCLIVCSFFDGIAFSGGMVHDRALGLIIFTGQVLHVVPEGLLASSLILAADGKVQSAKKAAFATGIFFLLGALIPGLVGTVPVLMDKVDMIHNFFLAFSAGILLYVGMAQLVPASGSSKFDSGLIVAGSLAFLVLHSLIHHIH